jgi:hypothetical protein
LDDFGYGDAGGYWGQKSRMLTLNLDRMAAGYKTVSAASGT